jgi:hypothetical protein
LLLLLLLLFFLLFLLCAIRRARHRVSLHYVASMRVENIRRRVKFPKADRKQASSGQPSK